jgi:hypothetical protein
VTIIVTVYAKRSRPGAGATTKVAELVGNPVHHSIAGTSTNAGYLEVSYWLAGQFGFQGFRQRI